MGGRLKRRVIAAVHMRERFRIGKVGVGLGKTDVKIVRLTRWVRMCP